MASQPDWGTLLTGNSHYILTHKILRNLDLGSAKALRQLGAFQDLTSLPSASETWTALRLEHMVSSIHPKFTKLRTTKVLDVFNLPYEVEGLHIQGNTVVLELEDNHRAVFFQDQLEFLFKIKGDFIRHHLFCHGEFLLTLDNDSQLKVSRGYRDRVKHLLSA